MTHDEYESYIKTTSDEAFDNVASGEWDKEQFYDWYTANVMEAQNEAVYCQNLQQTITSNLNEHL